MAQELSILLILFWAPVTTVIILNILWDHRYWRSTNYDFRQIYHHLRWNFSSSHRRPYRTWLKLLSFLLVSSIIFNSATIIPGVGIILALLIWSSESLFYLEDLSKNKIAHLPSNLRGISVFLCSIFLASLLPITLTYLLFQSQNFLDEVSVIGIVITKSLYLYLIAATLLGIALDLGTPIIVAISVALSWPIKLVREEVLTSKASFVLNSHSNLVVIGVTGSYGKTVIKTLLKHFLERQYNVVTTPMSVTTVSQIAKFILTEVSLDTEVLIVDVSAFKPGDVRKISRLIEPHIAVINGIDESHIALFGSKEETLMAKSQILAYLKPGGTAVLNIDDELVSRLAYLNNSREILYSSKSASTNIDRQHNSLEVDHLDFKISSKKSSAELIITQNEHTLKFDISPKAKEFGHSITAAVSIAYNLLGVSLSDIEETLFNYEQFNPELQYFEGDHHTSIIYTPNYTNIKQFEYALQRLADKPQDSRILVTSGIYGLGKHKPRVYSELKDLIVSSADVVLSYDKDLITSLGNKPQYVHLTHPDDMLYQLRARAEAGDTILIHGDIDPHIIESIRG